MKRKFLPMMFVAASMFLAACAPSPSEVATKIQEHKELTKEDYSVAADYMLKAMEEVSDSISAYENDRERLVECFKSMMGRYEDGNTIFYALSQTDPASLDEETRKVYEKAMALQEENARRFAAAMGYSGTVLDPDHSKEAAEDSAASAPVIAAGDSVAVLKAD